MTKRYKVIACEIAFRELCLCASRSKAVLDFVFMTNGLHDKGGAKMREILQKEIDKVDVEKYDAILLVYGLCSNGVVGLHSNLPIVIPKAHDCITFFLGSKEKYKEFFNTYTGTYVYTSGWIEREFNVTNLEDGITTQLGMNKTYREYVEEYGEENAQYIMEMLGGHEASYDKILLINTGVGEIVKYRKKLLEKSQSLGWRASEIDGDLSLLQKLLDGDWCENDFTIIPPNGKITATNDDDIIGYKQNV